MSSIESITDVVPEPIESQPWYLRPLPELVYEKLTAKNVKAGEITWNDVARALREKIILQMSPMPSPSPVMRAGETRVHSSNDLFFRKINAESPTETSSLAVKMSAIVSSESSAQATIRPFFHKSLNGDRVTGQVIFKRTV